VEDGRGHPLRSSRGAAAAVQAARLLQASGIAVDLLLTVDPVMIDPKLGQKVPTNVKHLVNFFEQDSPLLATHLAGDLDYTDVENRQLPEGRYQPHRSADEWVLYSDQLVRLISDLQEDQRRKREQKPPCSAGDKSCTVDR
jgi:hypothetical protein